MKRCPKCGATKPLSDFTPDKSKAGGYSSWCKACVAARSKSYYHRTNGEKAKARYQANRTAILAASRQYLAAHREELNAAERARYHSDAAYREKKAGRRRETYDPAKERLTYMRRHGGIDEWTRLWNEQGGCCYLCGQTLEGVPQKLVAVDHDHECHPSSRSRTESCSACRRGLAHAWCNQLLGLCGEDMGVLRAIVANFERVNAETKARIADRLVVVESMPDLDMPEGASWSQWSQSRDSALF
jgi:hypothetical protein